MSADVNAYVDELAAIKADRDHFKSECEQAREDRDRWREHYEADHAALQRVHGLIAKFAANAKDAETRSQDSERDLIHTYYAGKCEGWEDAKDELESAFNPDSSTPVGDTGGAG